MQTKYKVHNHPVEVPGPEVHVKQMHSVSSENPPDAEMGSSDCVRYTSRTKLVSDVKYPVSDVAHFLRCPVSMLIAPNSWQFFEKYLFQITSSAAMQRNYH